MTRTWTIDSPARHDVGGPDEPVTDVTATLVSGRIDVVSRADSDTLHCEVHDVAGLPITASFESGRFRLDGHKDGQGQLFGAVKDLVMGSGRRSARVTLSVPPGVGVTLNTVGADVLVAGVGGDVSITTVSGRVRLGEVGGRVDVKTVSGQVEAQAPTGELRARTVSGDITVEDGRPRAVKVATVSGAILLDLRGRSTLVTVNAGTSDVTLRLPRGCGYDVTATSGSGHVVVDGHTLSGGAAGEKGGHRSEGDRAIAVKARTASGNIVVLRADGAAPSDVQDVRPSERAGRAFDVPLGRAGLTTDPLEPTADPEITRPAPPFGRFDPGPAGGGDAAGHPGDDDTTLREGP